MAPSTACDAASEGLGCHAFVPPKSSTDQYDLLQALVLEAGGSKNGFTLKPLHVGMTGDTLKGTASEQRMEELATMVRVAALNTPQDSYQDIKKHSGGGGKISSLLFPGSADLGFSADSDYVVAWRKMSVKKIETTMENTDVIQDCLLDFCRNSASIDSHFKQAGTLATGTVHMGVGIVTSNFNGNLFVQDAKEFHVASSAAVTDPGTGIEVVDVSAGFDNASKRKMYGAGTIGVHVQFYHLKKTRMNPKIRIKESFPIYSNESDCLGYLLGSWSAAVRRALEPNAQEANDAEVARGLAVHEDYPMGGNFAGVMQLLIQEADDDTTMHVIPEGTDSNCVASLREVGLDGGAQVLEENSQQDPAGWLGQFYERSRNVMYYAPLERMMAISQDIGNNGTVTIDGRVFDGIKPAIKVEFTGSLPIVYKQELSGAVKDDKIPGYVLRGNEQGGMFTLWEVAGLENKNGSIVTANKAADWCVRETIEYVAQGNQERVGELEAAGFARLHQDEADADEADVSALENGELLIMGRQILAKTGFFADDPDDSDEESTESISEPDQGQSLAGVPSVHRRLDTSEAASTTTAPGPAPEVPPTVTASSTGLASPPRKKPKN